MGWDGRSFSAAFDGEGYPVSSNRIPLTEGGSTASSPWSKYFWGPSLSWNNYLKCWVMLMAKAEGSSCKGNNIYISYNKHADLSQGTNSQDWSKPKMLLKKAGHTIWYPSFQPRNNYIDRAEQYSSLNLGKRARLFFKDNTPASSEFTSEYIVEFRR